MSDSEYQSLIEEIYEELCYSRDSIAAACRVVVRGLG
jgi:hypothetical protein